MSTLLSRFTCVGMLFAAAAVAPAQQALSLTERAWIAGKVYSSALQYFAHWEDVPQLDADAAYRRYLDQVLARDDRREFSRSTLEFLAAFRNSHTTLIDQPLIKEHGALPFTARFVEGKWVVVRSSAEGLKPGDVIDSIDEQSFEQFFLNTRRSIPASTEGWARHALFARMGEMAAYAHLLPDRFTLSLDDGRKIAIDRTAVPSPPGSETEGRWLEPGKLAYIRIPSFFNPAYEKRALELLNQFRLAPALIVDVRGNTGGSTPGQLTSELMDRPYRWWIESTPLTLPYFRFRASQGTWELQPFSRPEVLWRNPPQQPAKTPFTGKLALLIDAGCHSACEDFVMPFKDNGRAKLIGEPTAGSTGQPFMVEVGHGMLVLIGAKRERFPDGSQFESVGIKPDLPIAPSIEDLRAGRDRLLDMARTALLAAQ